MIKKSINTSSVDGFFQIEVTDLGIKIHVLGKVLNGLVLIIGNYSNHLLDTENIIYCVLSLAEYSVFSIFRPI